MSHRWWLLCRVGDVCPQTRTTHEPECKLEMVALFSHTTDVEAAGMSQPMSRQHHGKKTFAAGPGTHTHTHTQVLVLYFLCVCLCCNSTQKCIRSNSFLLTYATINTVLLQHFSTTLFSNTLVQHFDNNSLQHSCPTHLDNTSLQHSPVQHVFTTLLPLTSLQPLLQHFSTTLFSTLLYNTLLQQTCLLTLLIKHNHKNTTTNKTQPFHRKHTTTKKITQPHHKNSKRPWKNHQKTQNNYEHTNIQPTDKSDKNTTTLPLFLSTPNMLCVQFPRHSEDPETSSTAPSRNSANLVNSEIVLCTQLPRGTAMTLRKMVLCAYTNNHQNTRKVLSLPRNRQPATHRKWHIQTSPENMFWLHSIREARQTKMSKEFKRFKILPLPSFCKDTLSNMHEMLHLKLKTQQTEFKPSRIHCTCQAKRIGQIHAHATNAVHRTKHVPQHIHNVTTPLPLPRRKKRSLKT